MFDWFVAAALTPELQAELTGRVAAEMAYATIEVRQAPDPAPKPKPIDPNCPTCKGTGKVRTGDDQGWTKCPTCQAEEMQLKAAPTVKAFKQSSTLPDASRSGAK